MVGRETREKYRKKRKRRGKGVWEVAKERVQYRRVKG